MKVNKKVLMPLLSATLSVALLAGCGGDGEEKKGSINSGTMSADGIITVANSPEEVIANQKDLTPLAQATNFTFDCETLEYSFTGVEEAGFYFIRVYPVENGVESNSASFQSDKIDGKGAVTYSGTIEDQTLLAGEYNVYVVASGSGYSSSEVKISGTSYLLAAPSLSAKWNSGNEEDPTVTATITVTAGDSYAKDYTVTITNESGAEVYRKTDATTEPITITAEDLGVEALTVEDVYHVTVEVNAVSGYTLPAAVSADIEEQRGWGGSDGGSGF